MYTTIDYDILYAIRKMPHTVSISPLEYHTPESSPNPPVFQKIQRIQRTPPESRLKPSVFPTNPKNPKFL